MRFLSAFVLLVSTWSAIAWSPALARAQSEPADTEIARLREQVTYAQYPDAITSGERILARTDITARQRNTTLELVATAQIASRQTDAATGTLARLYARDPDHRLTDPDASPPVVSAFARAREAHPPTISLDLQHASPRLTHREPPQIDVRALVGADAVDEVRLRYRGAGEPGWSQVVMNRRDAASWTGRIPVVGRADTAHDVAYYLVALAPSGAELARVGSEAEPLQLRIPAEIPDARADAMRTGEEDRAPMPAQGRSIAEEPAFWVVLVVVVVGAAVGVGVGVAVSQPSGPEQGTLGSVTLMRF